MMVEPAPMLPVLPTATQSLASEQEIPVRSTAFAGGLWSDQVEPLFDVLMTYGVELRFVPTAMQVVGFGQAMDPSCDPKGIEDVCCQVEKLVVVKEVAPPPEATPTATQAVDTEHAKDLRKLTDGWPIVVQVFPLTVPMIAGTPPTRPIAAQVIAFEHDTDDKESVPDGGV
jgi:hypothetical protein